jgi:hypothetical protein
MVVDALDLCYTKEHVDTFVIVSGDSDFSPLVSKLRENNKQVIGVGVKHSTSDLLIANCDEFIFYDDLVRKAPPAKRPPRNTRKPAKPAASAKAPVAEPLDTEEQVPDDKSQKALDLVVNTFDALNAERGGEEKIWGSMIKQALKRRNPGFNETYHGFRSFNSLLEEAAIRGLLRLEHDEKSGGYLVRSTEAGDDGA